MACAALVSFRIALAPNSFFSWCQSLATRSNFCCFFASAFSLYVFSYTTFAFGWAGLYVAHIGLIFAVYMTFKNFHKAEERSSSVFKTKNFDPFKIMVIVFVVVFIFIFSKGIEVLTSPNPSSYSIPYDGPSKSAFEKWLPFTKGK